MSILVMMGFPFFALSYLVRLTLSVFLKDIIHSLSIKVITKGWQHISSMI
jgi:hypothetical protein